MVEGLNIKHARLCTGDSFMMGYRIRCGLDMIDYLGTMPIDGLSAKISNLCDTMLLLGEILHGFI